jgi:hypothetical protein
LTQTRGCVKIRCIGVVRDLSRLCLDWTGQRYSGRTPLLLGVAIGWPLPVKEK